MKLNIHHWLVVRSCLLLAFIVLFFGVFRTSLFCENNNFHCMIMSEQKIQDENSVATEQNSMVQRIALEVKRREPSSVSDIFYINIC
jgi:hypothetical protein